MASKGPGRYSRTSLIVGYALGYTIFTGILYGILRFTDKLPPGGILGVIMITALISILGETLRRKL